MGEIHSSATGIGFCDGESIKSTALILSESEVIRVVSASTENAILVGFLGTVSLREDKIVIFLKHQNSSANFS